MTNEFDLHESRLATSDEEGRRLFLHPADVHGRYRRWRTRTQWILILFFLGLPWVRIHGKQAVLLNLSERHFEIFGLSLRAHNSPLLVLVLAAAAFGLFFVTAVYGRIWCGWACPQTVFIDGVFRKIERWIEGAALERRKLDRAPWSMKKVWKRSAKWSLFLGASLILTHSFLAYFVGTERLAQMIVSSPLENRGDFLFMILATGFILFDFAWFREQFCTIICPYGRFQSVIMDKTSLVVSYDSARGEPRSTPQAKAIVKTHGGKLGDCVNCYRCVQVCPTGIDIRRGVQMECIACTACIDACDDVMTKVKKPTGLIKYDSMTPTVRGRTRFNARSIAYLTLCLASVFALAFFTSQIQPIEFEILRAKEAPYTVLPQADGTVVIINHFKIKISNLSGDPRKLVFALAGAASPSAELITATQPYPLSQDTSAQVDVFVRFAKSQLVDGKSKIRVSIKDADGSIVSPSYSGEEEVTLVGPAT